MATLLIFFQKQMGEKKVYFYECEEFALLFCDAFDNQ